MGKTGNVQRFRDFWVEVMLNYELVCVLPAAHTDKMLGFVILGRWTPEVRPT